MSSSGNASVVVLIIFVAISAVFLSAAAFSGGLIKLSYGLESDYNDRAALAAEARKVIGLLARDPTPEADSPLDPVWAEVALPETPGLKMTLEDVSSRINPNAAVDVLLREMKLLKPDKLYEQFQKHRLENGPFADLGTGYADYLAADASEKFCTAFTYFNVNTAEENMVYRLFEERTGKKASSTTFPTHLRSSKTNKTLVTEKNIKEVLGVEWNAVYPFISAVPDLNVNFVDKGVLAALFAVAKNIYKMELKGDIPAVIMEVRRQTEITEPMLPALVQPKFKGTILEAYLGCKTWFWAITAEKGDLEYRCVVARLPAAPGEKEKSARLRLVEETFVKREGEEDARETAAVDE